MSFDVRASWALRTYEHFQRQTEDICDVVYYDAQGREVAFISLMLQEDGTFVVQGPVRESCANPDYLACAKFVQTHYDAIYAILMTVAKPIMDGLAYPQVLVK